MLWIIKLLNTRIFAWGVLIFTLVFTLSAFHRMWVLTHQPDPSQAMAQEVESLKTQVLGQQQEFDSAQQTFFQEQIIRNDLNMQRPGETVIQVPLLPTATPFVTPTPLPTQPVPQQWLELVR